jgi:membrane protein YqaA with SNARE-associated domain
LGWNQAVSWLKAMAPALGGFGLLLSAFLDSSFIPLPLVTDLVLMELCIRHPLRTPYYSGMAAIGSLAGCVWIYWLARKGGQAYYRRTQGHAPGRIRRFVQNYPMACVFLPAVAPFPVPFKPFVIAQGVFQVPFVTFVAGTLLGRGLLFFCEGFLAARYGAVAKDYLLNQPWAAVALALGLVAIFLAVRRLSALRRTEYSQTD